MNIEDYNYELPAKLIAQTPIKNRDESKLIILDKKTGDIEHKSFKNIIDYLKPGDTMVLNNTKVIPARLIGTKEKTGATIEILLLENKEKNIWECLAKPTKRLKIGTIIVFGDGLLKAQVIQILNDGIIHIELQYTKILSEILADLGQMPLPPYIKEKLSDKNRYQTVYAKVDGSAAAPTAGLHFTEELLKQIKNKGINIVFVTLHVGLGTFRPGQVENINEHKMHSETYHLDEATANILNNTISQNKRIIAVGTTSARTLATVFNKFKKYQAASGITDIFIYPEANINFGFNCLITNFHLPKSTLLMLVSAFSDKEKIKKAYSEAIKQKYRFFSFGDAMFIKED